MNKTIWIFGRRFEVCGSDIDDYYVGLRHGVELDLVDSVLGGIRPFVKDDAVCLDVGANIGLYTLALAALAPKGSVWGFEPAPATFGFLSKNIEINGLAHAHSVHAAVGDITGTVEFQDIPFFTAGSFAVTGEPFLTTEVLGSLCIKTPSITIDQFMADQGLERLDFVKVDVEGGELSVLDGAKQTLATHRPLVVLEFNSFGLSFHNAVLPQRALLRILETFPHVYVMDRTDGSPARLETPTEAYELLYENGIHGPADNLLCSFDDLGVEERYHRLVSHKSAATAGTRVEALERTLSWRVTAPLRRTRLRVDVNPRARAITDRLRAAVLRTADRRTEDH